MNVYLHKPVCKGHAVAEVVGTGNMPIQRRRVELGEDVHFVDTTVDAVAHRYIDEAVCTTYWYLLHKVKKII